ncbi:MAG: glucokinase [Myxococcales bacterium]|nr:glucokinase [Myxococcales bacterium]MCB9735149.1 glucokinase [Deltaproteobacteria bacterium]
MGMWALAGDVGGTKTLLALYERDEHGVRRHALKRYPSPRFGGPEEVLRDFLADAPAPVDAAALGVAGPVEDGVCDTTNLPWRVDAAALGAALGIPRVTLVNDFEAIARGIPHVHPGELLVLQDAPVVATAPYAVLGAGTGLGEAIAIRCGGALRVLPSEGGHKDFAPHDELGIELLGWLLSKHDHVSWERVLSGPGLVTLHAFLIAAGHGLPMVARPTHAPDDDPAAIIGTHAVDGTDTTCVRAAELFASLLGAEAGNLALTALAYGGVFVTGGVATKLAPILRDGAFMRAFVAKGRMSHLLRDMRVAIVTDPEVGLLGARDVALTQTEPGASPGAPSTPPTG